jgi:hypothetical protein
VYVPVILKNIEGYMGSRALCVKQYRDSLYFSFVPNGRNT